MTKFKSLLYREFRLSRKVNILNALMTFLFIGMMWGMLLTSQSDNMEDLESLRSALSDIAVTYTALIGIMPVAINDVFQSDLNSGWLAYSYVLPITPSERALARIVRTAVLTAAGMIFGTLNIIGYCAFLKRPFIISYIVIQFIALDMMLITTIINEFFTLSARNLDELKKMSQRSGMISFSLMIIVVYIIIKKKKISMNGFGDDSSIENLDLFSRLSGGMLLWLIPLTLLIIAVHFAVVFSRLRSAYGISAGVKKEKPEKTENISNNHEYPTGFLYKEIVQNRLGIIFVAFLPLGLILWDFMMNALIALTDEKVDLIESATGIGFRIGMLCAGVLLSSGLISGVFHGDDKKLWAYFTVSTPAGVKGFIYYKYILVFAMNGLYMVTWVFTDSIVSTLRYAVTGEEADNMTGVILSVFFLLLFMSALDIPFIVRYGAKKGGTIKLIIMLSIAIAVTAVFALLPESIEDRIIELIVNIYNGEANNTVMLITSVCPMISLAVYVLSYRISCRIFMKGVNEYDK